MLSQFITIRSFGILFIKLKDPAVPKDFFTYEINFIFFLFDLKNVLIIFWSLFILTINFLNYILKIYP